MRILIRLIWGRIPDAYVKPYRLDAGDLARGRKELEGYWKAEAELLEEGETVVNCASIIQQSY